MPSARPAALVTAIDKERLVEILFDEVIGLGPLEALLRDPEVREYLSRRGGTATGIECRICSIIAHTMAGPHSTDCAAC